MLRPLAVACLALVLSPVAVDACTAITVGRKASVDGSLFTTHTNDCTNCDVRIGQIPSQKHEDGAMAPVFLSKQDYPRYIALDRGDAYKPENLDKSVLTNFDRNSTSEKIAERYLSTMPHRPIGYVKQATYTSSYMDGNYAMINEYGLSIGESTCAASLIAFPYPQGHALFDVAALTRIAAQRCATARCAIRLMGELSEQFGYYGGWDPEPSGEGMYGVAGEAITLVDNEEAWVFHILPDDTGKSSVWVAQRVPDDHVSVVINKFSITKINLDDRENFMGSSNIYDVARRTGLWLQSEQDAGVFSFKDVFTPQGREFKKTGWSDRRAYQLYRLIAPSLALKPDQEEEYPFSVKPDKLISLQDMFRFNRDVFEGTEYDLTVGPAAGPFGNPVRYDPNREPYARTGYFERPVSLHRTAYATVVQNRPWMPRILRGVLWFGQHAPHASTFVPFYAASKQLPPSYQRGTIFKLDRKSSWWAFAAVANYAEKMYNKIIVDIQAERNALESEAMAKLKQTDVVALKLLSDKGFRPPRGAAAAAPASASGFGPDGLVTPTTEAEEAVRDLLTKFTVELGEKTTERWWNLFDHLLTKFRDGFILEKPHPPTTLKPVFYPAWWLGMVGFYNNGPFPPFMRTHGEPYPTAPHPDADTKSFKPMAPERDHANHKDTHKEGGAGAAKASSPRPSDMPGRIDASGPPMPQIAPPGSSNSAFRSRPADADAAAPAQAQLAAAMAAEPAAPASAPAPAPAAAGSFSFSALGLAAAAAFGLGILAGRMPWGGRKDYDALP